MNGNLTPEMLAMIKRAGATGWVNGGIPAGYGTNATSPSGMDHPGEGPSEFYGPTANGSDAVGTPFPVYDTQGTYMRDNKIQAPENNGMWDLAMMGALGGGIFSGMGGLGALGGAEGAAAGGPGSAGWGMDLGGAGLADTSYAANIGAAGGAAGAGGAGSLGAAGATGGGMGALGGSSAGAGALGSLGSMGGLLGPAATLLGGALGSQGNKQTNTSSRTMDPRLNDAVYGANGIVPQTQGLLNQQMSPARQQGYLDMQKYGQGLLSQPIAGNGFAKFSGR